MSERDDYERFFDEPPMTRCPKCNKSDPEGKAHGPCERKPGHEGLCVAFGQTFDSIPALNAQAAALVETAEREERRATLAEVWNLMLDSTRPGHAPDWSGFVDKVTQLREARDDPH